MILGWYSCSNSDDREAWLYIIKECHKAMYIWVQGWIYAYASMHRLIRPPVISGHTRLISGHTRFICCHTRLISGHTRLISGHTDPSPATEDRDLSCNTSPLAIHHGAREQIRRDETNKVIPIVASLKPCVSEQGKSTTVAWGWPSIEKPENPRAKMKSETTLSPTLNPPLSP